MLRKSTQAHDEQGNIIAYVIISGHYMTCSHVI